MTDANTSWDIRAKSSSNGQHYDYWYCLGRATGKTPDCPQKYIPADIVHSAVEDYFYTLELLPERIGELRKLLAEGIGLALTAHDSQTKHYKQRLAQLEKERKSGQPIRPASRPLSAKLERLQNVLKS